MAKVYLLYLILALHVAGLVSRAYWTVPYYDKPLHLLGGFWLAMMASYLVERTAGRNFFRDHHRLRFLFLIGFVMTVGFVWEGYEFFADNFIFHRAVSQLSVADTMSDLFSDFLGAIAYAVFFRKAKLD